VRALVQAIRVYRPRRMDEQRKARIGMQVDGKEHIIGGCSGVTIMSSVFLYGCTTRVK
jgi:hypothetical protein